MSAGLATPLASPTAAADRYLAERVMTASPAELTAMLYDACVGALKVALRLQEAGDHVAAIPRLSKAQDILLELRTTLNPAAGSEARDLAGRLDALYTFAWQQLLQAGFRRDPAGTRAALDVVEPIQLAWRSSCLTARVA